MPKLIMPDSQQLTVANHALNFARNANRGQYVSVFAQFIKPRNLSPNTSDYLMSVANMFELYTLAERDTRETDQYKKLDTLESKLDKDQLQILSNTLSAYVYLNLGNFRIAFETINAPRYDTAIMTLDQHLENRDKYRAWLDTIRKIIFPELQPNESYGVGSPDINPETQIAYDMHQVIRHYLWKTDTTGPSNNRLFTVDANPPLQFAPQLPLIKITK